MAIGSLIASRTDSDWYALATYSRDTEVRADFTKQSADITNSYNQLDLPGWSEINTYDAVYEMLDKLGRLPGRRIVVLIGSGLDTFSAHTLDQVLKKAESESVTVFSVALGSAFRTTFDLYLSSSARLSLVQAQAFLQGLAAKSGGYAWFPNQAPAFRDAIDALRQRLDTQYRLVLDLPPGNGGPPQKLKVEAFRIVNDRREDFKVTVRDRFR